MKTNKVKILKLKKHFFGYHYVTKEVVDNHFKVEVDREVEITKEDADYRHTDNIIWNDISDDDKKKNKVLLGLNEAYALCIDEYGDLDREHCVYRELNFFDEKIDETEFELEKNPDDEYLKEDLKSFKKTIKKLYNLSQSYNFVQSDDFGNYFGINTTDKSIGH